MSPKGPNAWQKSAWLGAPSTFQSSASSSKSRKKKRKSNNQQNSSSVTDRDFIDDQNASSPVSPIPDLIVHKTPNVNVWEGFPVVSDDQLYVERQYIIRSSTPQSEYFTAPSTPNLEHFEMSLPTDVDQNGHMSVLRDNYSDLAIHTNVRHMCTQTGNAYELEVPEEIERGDSKVAVQTNKHDMCTQTENYNELQICAKRETGTKTVCGVDNSSLIAGVRSLLGGRVSLEQIEQIDFILHDTIAEFPTTENTLDIEDHAATAEHKVQIAAIERCDAATQANEEIADEGIHTETRSNLGINTLGLFNDLSEFHTQEEIDDITAWVKHWIDFGLFRFSPDAISAWLEQATNSASVFSPEQTPVASSPASVDAQVATNPHVVINDARYISIEQELFGLSGAEVFASAQNLFDDKDYLGCRDMLRTLYFSTPPAHAKVLSQANLLLSKTLPRHRAIPELCVAVHYFMQTNSSAHAFDHIERNLREGIEKELGRRSFQLLVSNYLRLHGHRDWDLEHRIWSNAEEGRIKRKAILDQKKMEGFQAWKTEQAIKTDRIKKELEKKESEVAKQDSEWSSLKSKLLTRKRLSM